MVVLSGILGDIGKSQPPDRNEGPRYAGRDAGEEGWRGGAAGCCSRCGCKRLAQRCGEDGHDVGLASCVGVLSVGDDEDLSCAAAGVVMVLIVVVMVVDRLAGDVSGEKHKMGDSLLAAFMDANAHIRKDICAQERDA